MTEHVSPVATAAAARPATDEADVIVVGAGPSGSTTAYYLASAGLDVLLLEKSRFPREKVCGDGLTPRAVKALVAMGVPISESDGWLRNKGLRVVGAGMRLELPWPDLTSYPGYGLVRNRLDFDQRLAERAQQGRGAADRGRQRDRPGHRRAHRPDHRRDRPPGRRPSGRRCPRRRRGGTGLPGPPRHRRRRELLPAVGLDGPAQAGRPPDRCGRPRLLHQPPPRGRLPGVLARPVGR